MDPLISAAILSPVLLALSLVILRLLLDLCRHHGLHKNARQFPPGPWALPIIGNLHMLGAMPHRAMYDLAKKYGPLMSLRLGNVPAIVISSPEMAKLVLKTHNAILSGRPQVQVMGYLSYGNRDMVCSPYGPYWRSVRKLTTLHLLCPSKLEFFGPVMREEVAAAVARIRAAGAAGDLVDVSAEVSKLTGDMGCRMILGCTASEKVNLKSLIYEVMRLSGTFNIADYLPFLAPFDLQGIVKRLKVAQNELDKVLEDIIDENERNRALENQGNLMDTLLGMNNEVFSSDGELPILMERANIKAIILDLIIASYDTSSTTIEWAMSELMRNSRAMDRVQNELQSVVGMSRLVEEADLPKLSYMEMVVKETLRLHPVAPLLVPHEAMEDVTIDGYHIPKKSRIYINAWAIGRDQNAWSGNAYEFYPERFIGTKIDYKNSNFQFIPFGSGRRACPGMMVGLTMVRLILAQLVHCFTWELADGKSPEDLDMKEVFGLSAPRATPLLLKPTYRLHT